MIKSRCWTKREFILLAAVLVFLVTGGCDPATDDFVEWGVLNMVEGVSQSFVTAGIQVLLQSFPSADILQALFGGNRQPFFTG
ncbi:MAG: hypothetical protein JXQ75_06370 [Phycisphaerae bacterium]|nr:hypothetical protein [Phycisphaerae bacterium]